MASLNWRRMWPAAALSLGGLGVVGAYGTLYERHNLRDHTLEIGVPGLPQTYDGYRIVQLSDFHIGGKSWSADTVARSVSLAMTKGGNLIVLSGDFIETTPGIAACRDLLSPLRAPDGIVAVLGNHDYSDQSIRVQALMDMLTGLGVRVLRNESMRIRHDASDLWLVGIDDGYSGHDYLPKALIGVPVDARPIVISHYPDSAWRLGPGRWAVVLSGHTHGSQIRLPFIARYARERIAKTRFSHGLYCVNRTPVFVTTGVGTSGHPLRIFSRPEVATIVLRAAPAAIAS
jgi:predicted MPP superfamily phosphohydrolase